MFEYENGKFTGRRFLSAKEHEEEQNKGCLIQLMIIGLPIFFIFSCVQSCFEDESNEAIENESAYELKDNGVNDSSNALINKPSKTADVLKIEEYMKKATDAEKEKNQDSVIYYTTKAINESKLDTNSILYAYRAVAKYRKEDLYGAISDYDKAFEAGVRKNKMSYEYKAISSYLKYELGDIKNSISELEELSIHNPDIDIVTSFLFNIYSDTDDIENAKTKALKLIKFPDLDYKMKGLKFLNDLAVKENNYSDMILYLDKLLELSKKNNLISNPIYYRNLGIAKIKTNDFYGGISTLLDGISLNPNYGDFYIYLGEAKINLGNKQGACEDWKKALKMDITNTDSLKDLNLFMTKYCN